MPFEWIKNREITEPEMRAQFQINLANFGNENLGNDKIPLKICARMNLLNVKKLR